MTRDEFFQELFQRPPTQEEQHRFDRFQNVMSLATDDSMWYVILVNEFYDNKLAARLQDVENVANSAAKAALVKIGEAVNDKAEEIAAVRNQGFLWRSWGLMLSLVVLFGAVCVNAGYVMGSGKYPFWLTPQEGLMKVAGYFLNVPSGWILLIGCSPFLLNNFTSAMAASKRNARLGVKGNNGVLALQAMGALMAFILILLLVIATF